MTTSGFDGFPTDLMLFLDDLAVNNNRTWFEDNRDRYETSVIAPARAFVEALGDALEGVAPDVEADPRIDRSIFRMHRDTRFSKDKSPYKTHLAMFLWEGSARKMACSGFYVHIEPTKLVIGAGVYRFESDGMKQYRAAVDDEVRGAELQAIADRLAVSEVHLHGSHYKRVPRGFEKDHPRADLLRHNGLFAIAYEDVPPEALHTAECVDWMTERLVPVAPLHRWLVDTLEGA